jgi:hypothetical protein
MNRASLSMEPALACPGKVGTGFPKKDMLKRSGDIADLRKSGCCWRARSAKVRQPGR